MPIYAYKCGSCGHAKDVLQKMSDAQLTVCPACGAPAFTKQVTAAGFQLKGSGWYVTDFRGGNSGGAPAADAAEGKADTKSEARSDGAASPPAAAAPSGASTDAPKKEAASASTTSAPAVSSSNTSSS